MHNTPGVRKTALRMGIVLGKTDSVFPRLHNLVRCGLGGQQGNGRQMVSWIHEQDAAQIVEYVADHAEINGVLNCTAPNPVDNNAFMQTIRKACGVAIGLPCPAWLLELGALFIGTETELVLKSRWVVPARLLQAGYRFKYPQLKEAIDQCLQ